MSQAQLALGHVDSVIKAIASSCCLRDAISVICYIIVAQHKSPVEDIFRENFVRINRGLQLSHVML